MVSYVDMDCIDNYSKNALIIILQTYRAVVIINDRYCRPTRARDKRALALHYTNAIAHANNALNDLHYRPQLSILNANQPITHHQHKRRRRSKKQSTESFTIDNRSAIIDAQHRYRRHRHQHRIDQNANTQQRRRISSDSDLHQQQRASTSSIVQILEEN